MNLTLISRRDRAVHNSSSWISLLDMTTVIEADRHQNILLLWFLTVLASTNHHRFLLISIMSYSKKINLLKDVSYSHAISPLWSCFRLADIYQYRNHHPIILHLINTSAAVFLTQEVTKTRYFCIVVSLWREKKMNSNKNLNFQFRDWLIII